VSRARGLALAGGLAGAVALGVAGGLTAERRTMRGPRSRPDPTARELASATQAQRSSTVRSDDGVELLVEEVGPADAPLTVVFCHGYTLEMACWHFQRRDLGDLGRLVFWDQRSHGRSGPSAAERCTIDQLGSDLERVLDACAPTGPVVLVGHSMGGMTVMALADRRPDLFADGGRVVGTALISTSSGQLAQATLGVPAFLGGFLTKVNPRVFIGVGHRARFVDRGRLRGRGSDLSWSLSRRFSFGRHSDVSPGVVDLMERMVAATPVEVMAAFLPAFLSHDKLAALAALTSTSVLVLVGDEDLLTPVRHSQAIADALPDAELVVLPGAGHMVILERPQLVNLYLRALVSRALVRVADAA